MTEGKPLINLEEVPLNERLCRGFTFGAGTPLWNELRVKSASDICPKPEMVTELIK